MKIAVTYDNGNVFQHFGKTENFKVYEVEAEKVVSSEIIASNGTGHGALAGLLAEAGIHVLICGGIGEGAQEALDEAGIEVVSGAEGNTDEAVEAYLKGELISTGVNCDHHDHEEEEEDGCCANLNGHLFSVLFHGVKDVVIKGEECDNYTLLSSEIDENRISLSYEGNNLYEADSFLSLSFSYLSFEVEDEGKIASPDV